LAVHIDRGAVSTYFAETADCGNSYCHIIAPSFQVMC
jgi:hypothetical protein